MPSPETPILSIRQLSKRFPQSGGWRQILRGGSMPSIDALRGISLDVAPGEFYGLLGANGAGKTTLMKVIATLIVPDDGSVHVDGHEVRTSPAEVRRHMSLSLASERGLFWRLSARENLRIFAELHDVPSREVTARVTQALEDVGLVEAAERRVREFSSGMMQRLLIARALLPQPRLLLLDEPTRSLDPVSARAFRAFLKDELSQRRQCAVLLATHSPEEAFDLCRRVAIMDRGRIVAEGSARDLAFDLLGSSHLLTIDRIDPAIFEDLARRGVAHVRSSGPAEDPAWSGVVVQIPGGEAGAAEVVAALTTAGVRVAAMTRQQASLADLIEGVLAAQREVA